MNAESSTNEYKALQKVKSGIKELATSCVSFANSQGGIIHIGIDDKTKTPPSNQIITVEEINDTLTRLRSLCSNVGIETSQVLTHSNGGQYFSLKIYPSLKSIATTSDGKYMFVLLTKANQYVVKI